MVSHGACLLCCQVAWSALKVVFCLIHYMYKGETTRYCVQGNRGKPFIILNLCSLTRFQPDCMMSNTHKWQLYYGFFSFLTFQYPNESIKYPCGSEHLPYPLQSRDGVVARAALVRENNPYTTVAVSVENEHTIAFLGTAEGKLVKVSIVCILKYLYSFMDK